MIREGVKMVKSMRFIRGMSIKRAISAEVREVEGRYLISSSILFCQMLTF